jgi:predicted GH43/DUF377 family glycosyl hydrolase
MPWKRIGHIFSPEDNYPWMRSHASNPIAHHLEGDRFRVYFSCRDQDYRSSIAWLEIDINDPLKVLSLATTPLLGPGVRGSFDEFGTSLGCIVTVYDKLYLYYLGWNLPKTVPFRNSIGLAESDKDGLHFEKFSQGPVLDRNIYDPFSISYPWVIREKDVWKMWYGSHKTWEAGEQEFLHALTYATSKDGIHWRPSGEICINTKGKDYAFSKPCVIPGNKGYEMWYAYRGEAYQIGYAHSPNGTDWERQDQVAGLAAGNADWENEMVCYPHVFDHDDQRYMLYNGNKYGKTGFGLAIWEE